MSSDRLADGISCPGCRALASAAGHHPGFGASRIVRCDACGTEFSLPQPTDERLAEIYSAEYYEPWHHEDPESLQTMKTMTFAPVVREIERFGGRRILDLGCATGEFLKGLDSAGLDLFGVDLNAEAIARAIEAVPHGTFHCGTLADHPFSTERFDAITMLDFVEHVRDPETELRLACQRLADHGRLIISTPRMDSNVARATRRYWPQYREEHLTYFTRSGLSACLQRAGLVITSSFATRKAVTPAYVYGQALAYPLPLVTPIIRAAWRHLPVDSLGPRRLWFGEMTVVAERQSAN